MSSSQSVPTAPRGEEYPLPGLAGDVEVLIDRWGVPHIYATDRIDAFRAQGFQAARDRLFQIDLWRRRGLGLLSEVLGEAHVEQDRATRLFLYRGDMRTEWLSYSTDAKEVVTAFAGGVNAFVDWALEDPAARLPPEFGVLGYTPAHWSPEDVVRIRTHGLLYNVEQELARALTLRELGPDVEDLRSVRESDTPPPTTDDGRYDGLSDAVLDVYRRAFAPVDLASVPTPEAAAPSGSNNWVVAPSRTATGRPILANDPHRAVTLPALRYLAHLDAPGLSVIGAGEPQLPGISIGHNDRVAFGLTIWPADQEDLYVYDLHPDDDTRYSYRGAWEEMRVVEESAAVAGGDDTVHRLCFTRHGPVVFTDATTRTAVAVRAVWLQPGMVPYLASLEYQDAGDAEQFRRALRRWGAPAVNQLYATTDGDIGWQTSGMLPRRDGWDGSAPVPGDGRFEWEGYVELDDLPSALNPEAGWLTTSNQNNTAQSQVEVTTHPTGDWYSSARHERLSGLLGATDALDLATSHAMQTDELNLHGRRLLDALTGVELPDGTPQLVHEVWSELRAWDGVEAADSHAALVFQVWQRRHLRPWLIDACLRRAGVAEDVAARNRHRLLRADTLFSDIRPDQRMVDTFDLADEGDRAELARGLAETLPAALAEIEERLGVDPAATWGDLHRTVLRHAVLSRSTTTPAEWGVLPAVPRSGSGDTVGLAGHDADFNAVMGSSFRMSLDVGEWDDSLVLNSPGQSGDPRSPHYADLLDLWGSGGSFPLLYSRSAVESATVTRVLLRPAGTSA